MNIKGSPVKAKLSHNFVGSQAVYDSLLKEDRRDDIFKAFGNDDATFFFKERGKEIGTHSMRYTHREDTRANERIVATGAAGAANGVVTQTVVTDYRFTYSSVKPYTATNDTTTAIPRKQTLLLYPNGVKGLVHSVNANNYQYDVYPITAGESIPQVTADDIIVNLGVLAEEGSGFPEPIAFRTSEFEGGLSIAKDKMEITDIAHGESTWIRMPDNTWTWTLQNWSKLHRKVKNELEARMLVGSKITNPTLLNLYPEMATSTGYIQYIEDSGYVVNYDPIGGLAMVDFDRSIRKYDQINAPMEMSVFSSTDFNLKVDDLLKDNSGHVAYATFNNKKELALHLGFKSVTRGSYTYHMKNMPMFNHPEMLGAEGHSYKGSGIIVPSVGHGTNHRGEKVDFLCVRCFESEGGSYQAGWEEKVRGGIDGMNELEESVIMYYITIRKGFEAFGQEHHQLFREQQ